jgi:hypothetical protein
MVMLGIVGGISEEAVEAPMGGSLFQGVAQARVVGQAFQLSAVPCAQSAAGIYSSNGSFDRFACLEDGDNTQVFNGAEEIENG